MQQQLLVGLLRPALQPRAGLFPLGIIPPDLANFPPPHFQKHFSSVFLSVALLGIPGSSQDSPMAPIGMLSVSERDGSAPWGWCIESGATGSRAGMCSPHLLGPKSPILCLQFAADLHNMPMGAAVIDSQLIPRDELLAGTRHG